MRRKRKHVKYKTLKWFVKDFFTCDICKTITHKKHMGRIDGVCDSCEAKSDED